jgi:hypothetical protein
MDKKQTALEWLIGQLQQTRDYQRVINEANESSSSVRDVIKQAKEMEKEQIIDAHRKGQEAEKDYYNVGDKSMTRHTGNSMEYYELTYGGNK